MDKPSTIDRLHAREHAKPEIPNGMHERAERMKASAPQRHFEATARALPDKLFQDHPGVIAVAAAADAARARSKRLSTASKQVIAETVQRLQTEVHEAAAEVRLAALDDVLGGESAFPRALAAMEHHQRLQHQLAAAEMAQVTICSMPMGAGEFAAAVQAKENALRDLLNGLKREYLQARPELLEKAGA